MEEEERRYLKEQHFMRCPKCGMALEEIVFRGVHLDKCFSCGGMYFDEGELELILAKEKPDSFLSRVSGIFRGEDGGKEG
jgi:Zn-finger nucleic acid-binding protein